MNGVDQRQRDEMAIPTLLHANPLITWLFHRRYATIAELLDVPAGGSVLDFGCGVGCLLPSLTRAGLKVHAIDLVLDYARVVDSQLGLNVSFAESLFDLPDNGLDAIIAADVLEHVEDLNELLNLMRQKLRSQGCLVVSSPTENFAYRIGRLIAGFAGKGGYHHADASVVEGTIAASDAFRIDKTRTLPWNIPPHLFSVARFRAQ
ncbi:MAG: methyltransferase domain-containing protein [Coriobacteriia bacterium]|nr:methyltransferase domain-containing protein [Coriobacteriia bacterium]